MGGRIKKELLALVFNELQSVLYLKLFIDKCKQLFF